MEDLPLANVRVDRTQQEFSQEMQLPHVRCISCGKVTTGTNKYNEILDRKKVRYAEKIREVFNSLVDIDEDEALERAKKEASKYADLMYYKDLRGREMQLKRFCCMRTYFNPIIMPTGGAVNLHPDVDVGVRASQEKPPLRMYVAR